MKALLTNKTLHGRIIALIFIVVAGLFVQKDYMNEYPTHVHAWAEQDHYALALGFINNGFDLFHPETMIYNKQFPGWWKEAYDNTITSVDFPIHEYLVALLMKLFGTTSPWVFRLWTLLWGFTGLFFLNKVAFRITGSITKSILVVAFAMCSPVYAYFLNGFLPSVPALSLGIIGLWYYLKYYDGDTLKHFNLGIAFLTLAMLMRTTFAIEFIAILGFELLRIFRKESTLRDKLPSVFASAVLFLAYFLWNRHLRNLYGTLFLNELLPPEDWQDAKELIADTYYKWTFQYFQRSQYLLFVVLIILSAWCVFRSRRQTTENQTKQPFSLWWLAAIYTFGCLLFSIAMMQQMPYHDYYLIDTFFIPILLMVILLLKAIRINHLLLKIVLSCAVVVLCCQWFQGTKTMQEKRRKAENAALLSYIHFKDADLLLDSLDISCNAKILCLYGYPQNGPFIQMGRKGYTVMEGDDELLETAFSWDYDCIVIENSKFIQYFDSHKELLSRLKKIGGNDKITVCTPINTWVYQAAWQFFYPD